MQGVLKKSLALLLALIMVLAAMPTAFAANRPDAEIPDEGIGVWVGGQFVPVEWDEPSSSEEGIAPISLLPIQEKELGYIDLSYFFDEELKHVKLSDSIWHISAEGSADEIKAVWALSHEGQATNDQFMTYDPETGIDLRSADEEGRNYSSVYLQVIMGEHPEDQFDTANVRYTFYVLLPDTYHRLWGSFLNLELYESTEENAEPVSVDILSTTEGYMEGGVDLLRLIVADEYLDRELTLKLIPNEGALNSRGLTAEIFAGRFETVEEAEASDAKFPDSGYTAVYYKYPYPEFTAVFKRGDLSQLVHIDVCVTKAYATISFYPYSDICKPEDSFFPDCTYNYQSNYTYDQDLHTTVEEYTISLDYGLPADGEYRVRLSAYDSGDFESDDLSAVKHAAAGSKPLTEQELEELSEEGDIKGQLFSDYYGTTDGYVADFSKGVYFSVLTKYGDAEYLWIKTEEYDGPNPDTVLPSAPTPKSSDTYLRLDGVNKAGGNGYYNYYVMFYGDDDYYYNGYQTLFMLNSDNSPIADTQIVPKILTGNNIKLFLGHGADAAKKLEDSSTPVDVEFGMPIQYSVAAENGECLKNYWLTFVTKTENGPDLFINGVTNIDEGHIDAATGEPVREVTLDDENRFYHDVFFANIGNAPLSGLTVSLDETAKKYVAIDKYWSAEDETIPAFTDTDRHLDSQSYNTTYGALKNVGKIRLIPQDMDSYTNISGYLIFTYDVADGASKEIKVQLTGIAGTPEIKTETVTDGVRHVPYDCLIQTNSMGASDALSFRLSDGALPTGVELYPTGELYGMPSEAGEFTFEVELTDTAGKIVYDSAVYTVKIEDNTDEAVYLASDEGYELKEYVGTQDGEYHFVLSTLEDQIFASEGTFAQFYRLYIDGKTINENLYSAEEGSTIITIREQALRDAGSGTHTIAAEFRTNGSTEDGLPNGGMKRTAQNYSISSSLIPPSQPSYPNTPTTPSTSTTTPSTGEDKPETPPTHSRPGEIYPDIDESKWYHEAVDYVLEQELFVGYEDGTFRPEGTMTRAQAWIILSRMAGVNTSGSEPWYQAGLDWAVQNEISDGTNPGGSISRQEIVTMLWRLKGSQVSSSASLSGFIDVALVADWAQSAMAWAVENGIIVGRGNGILDPKADANRAECAAIIYRYSQMNQQ